MIKIGRKIRINLFSNGFAYNVSDSEVVFYMKKGNKNIVFNKQQLKTVVFECKNHIDYLLEDGD